ncbi:MAG: Rrf2 family transcriptional regulator [Dehalococcoidia bacterium]
MKVDYGVRMLVFLAQQPDGAYASTSDIARHQRIPEPYLLHICSELQKAGLIASRRGPQGGHKLAKPAASISVTDVVKSLDYSLAPLDCVDDADECTLSGACSQRELWSEVERMLLGHLSSVKIDVLASKQQSMRGLAEVKTAFASAG